MNESNDPHARLNELLTFCRASWAPRMSVVGTPHSSEALCHCWPKGAGPEKSVCPLQPLPPSPYQPRLTKARAPSLGSLTSHRPALPPTPIIPATPTHCPNVLQSKTLPDSSPAHGSSFPQLCDSLRTSWSFPPNSSLLQTPHCPLLTSPLSQVLGRLLLLLTFSYFQPPWGFFLLLLSNPHLRHPQVSPFSPTSSPHPTTPPQLYSRHPLLLAPRPRLPLTWGEGAGPPHLAAAEQRGSDS